MLAYDTLVRRVFTYKSSKKVLQCLKIVLSIIEPLPQFLVLRVNVVCFVMMSSTFAAMSEIKDSNNYRLVL